MMIASNLAAWRTGLATIAGAVLLATAFSLPSASASALDDVKAAAETAVPSETALPVSPPAPVPSAPQTTVEAPPRGAPTPAPSPAPAAGGGPDLAPTPSDGASGISPSGDGTPPSSEVEVHSAESGTYVGTGALEDRTALADPVRSGGTPAPARQSDGSLTQLSISPAGVVALQRWVAHIWPAIAFFEGKGDQGPVGIVRSLLAPVSGTPATGGSVSTGVESHAEQSAESSNEPLAAPHISPPQDGAVFTRTFFLLAAGWLVLVAILYRTRTLFRGSHQQRG
jgi:hypothetical protein